MVRVRGGDPPIRCSTTRTRPRTASTELSPRTCRCSSTGFRLVRGRTELRRRCGPPQPSLRRHRRRLGTPGPASATACAPECTTLRRTERGRPPGRSRRRPEERPGSGRGTSDASDGSTSSCSGIVGGSWSASINPASGEASGSIESGEGKVAERRLVGKPSVSVSVCECAIVSVGAGTRVNAPFGSTSSDQAGSTRQVVAPVYDHFSTVSSVAESRSFSIRAPISFGEIDILGDELPFEVHLTVLRAVE